ncbi:MAG: hypothetical protein ACLFVO_19300 [Chloroflexaceae bacterium]
MNETRETANAGMQQAIPGFDGGYRLRQGGRFHAFSQKFCIKCKIFVKKKKKSTMLPQAKRAVHPKQTPSLITDRVTPVNDTSYAVPPPEVDIASGRVEDSRSFSQKIHAVNFSVKKIKRVPCCRRRSGLQVRHQAEPGATA